MGYERLNLKTGEVITEAVFTHLEDGIEGASALVTPILYDDLVALRNAGQLKPGMFYRITDYVTTTTGQTRGGVTISAGHQFDIIVMALDGHTLSEEAKACVHEGDTYFTDNGANLAAWKIWYCLDNDTERFEWTEKDGNGFAVLKNTRNENKGYENGRILSLIKYEEPIFVEGEEMVAYHDGWDGLLNVSSNGSIYTEDGDLICDYIEIHGKGVIYRMIDEHGNDCPYDFKNILFLRGKYEEGALGQQDDGDYYVYCYTFSWEDSYRKMLDLSLVGNNGYITDDLGAFKNVCQNVIKPYRESVNDEIYMQVLNDIVMLSTYYYDGKLFYGCRNNKFGKDCRQISLGNSCHNNLFDNECNNIWLDGDCTGNRFGNFAHNIFLGVLSRSNTYGNESSANVYDSNGKPKQRLTTSYFGNASSLIINVDGEQDYDTEVSGFVVLPYVSGSIDIQLGYGHSRIYVMDSDGHPFEISIDKLK